MKNRRLHDWMGLSGVEEDESPRAIRWARRLEIPTIAIAMWILVVWYMETRQKLPAFHSNLLDYSVWFYFVAETGLLCFLVNDRWNYLKNNWLNLIIIIAGIPVMWGYVPYATGLRSLRLLIFVSLLIPISGTLRKILARNHLGATLVISLLVVFISGYIIAGIDPAVKSPADGIWWAWVTVSGVGYGDIVPVSMEGRLFAGLLIILGMALFSIFTANMSVYFISQAEASGEIEPSEERMHSIERRLQHIEKNLEELTGLLQQKNLAQRTRPGHPKVARSKRTRPKN